MWVVLGRSSGRHFCPGAVWIGGLDRFDRLEEKGRPIKQVEKKLLYAWAEAGRSRANIPIAADVKPREYIVSIGKFRWMAGGEALAWIFGMGAAELGYW